MKVETGLTVKGNAKLGKMLVDKAVEDHQQAQQKIVVGYVQEIMAYLEKQRVAMADCEDNIQLLEKKIEAMKEGDFVLDRHGHITFNDEKLQKSIVLGPEQCPNCGYTKSGVRPGVR